MLEAKYEAKLEFLGGEGGAKQKPSVLGVWIFSGTTHFPNVIVHTSYSTLLFCLIVNWPCCLNPICRIQRNIWLKTRQQGPINTETKELFIFRHLEQGVLRKDS